MEAKEYKAIMEEVLKKDDRLWNKEKTEFNKPYLFYLIDKIDETIIELLLERKEIRDKFFIKVKDVYVFEMNEFKFFIEEHKVFNSYTSYPNRIGLSDGKEFIMDRNDVVINFPFKDCILEGGQTSEEGIDTYFEYEEEKKRTVKGEKIIEPAGYKKRETKRKEVFFNQILAQDEIDRLLDEKAFVNWKRFTKDGEKEIQEIKRDSNGLIKENLIIKGNNLLALHSLLPQFNGKVKLVYIDPPFNTEQDSFKYNDKFLHSTWLTFMKNRLEAAKDLLAEEGSIFVHIDYNEMPYLKVLMDGIFDRKNFVQLISVKVSSAAGFKTVNPGPIDVTEYILFYTKNRKKFKFKKMFVPTSYDSNYNLVIKNPTEPPEKWILKSLREVIYEMNGIDISRSYYDQNSQAKELWGEHYMVIREQMMAQFALDNADIVLSKRDPHKPTEALKEKLELSKEQENKGKVLLHEKSKNDEDGDKYTYIYEGGALARYSNKVKEIDGVLTPTELLTDFWSDISWDGIAGEGGVSLKNGKKPEKLLRRIIELSTEEGDIVLDFFMGSGTTCAVSHKFKRQYIGIEQMDYIESLPVRRLKNVINGEDSGISKAINWKGGGDFIYCELAKWNEKAKEEIMNCRSLEELKDLFITLSDKYYLAYNMKINEFKNNVIEEDEFKKLPLEEQKRMFLTMLDINQLYVQKTEMEDKRFSISIEDQRLTKMFYGEE